MEKSLSYREFELPRVKLYENYMEKDLKGIENYFELTGSSSYRGFELPGVDCNPGWYSNRVSLSSKWDLTKVLFEVYAKIKQETQGRVTNISLCRVTNVIARNTQWGSQTPKQA